MRKLVISLAAAATAVAFASPAAAQYYPQPQHRPYGNAYGYNRGEVRALQVRINAVQQQIKLLDRRNVIRDDPADRLRAEARDIENRLHRVSRYGLNRNEANEIEVRIARLEQRVQRVVARNNGRYRRY